MGVVLCGCIFRSHQALRQVGEDYFRMNRNTIKRKPSLTAAWVICANDDDMSAWKDSIKALVTVLYTVLNCY